MSSANVAFADAEDEDRWTSKDRAELLGMVLAEAEAEVDVSDLPSGVIRRVRLTTSPSGRAEPAGGPQSDAPRKIPVWMLETLDERVFLRHGLLLSLEQGDDDGVLLGSPQLRMWGIGGDAFAALHDFARTFVSVLRSYEMTPRARMSADAVEYLEELQALIARREALQGT